MSNLTDALIAAKLVGGSGGSGGGSGSSIADTVMQGCYYAKLTGADYNAGDVAFYRLDGTPLYVYSTLTWTADAETGAGYWCETGEVTTDPELATISESELAYLTFKFYALFKKGDMEMGSSLRTAFDAAMTAVLDNPDYDGPTPVFIF